MLLDYAIANPTYKAVLISPEATLPAETLLRDRPGPT